MKKLSLLEKIKDFIDNSIYGPFILCGVVISIIIIDASLFAENRSPEYEILKIDGCEYVKSTNVFFGNTPIVHKANCPNHKK